VTDLAGEKASFQKWKVEGPGLKERRRGTKKWGVQREKMGKGGIGSSPEVAGNKK